MHYATHAGILTSDRSTRPHSRASTLQNAPLPHPFRGIRSFGDRLEPRYIFGAEPLDQ
jgi:hypothetical protein